MRFKYCPHCGKELIKKEIGDEGLIPYCESCKVPLWDMFTTSVICAVVNEYNEIALIQQSYGPEKRYVCVAGIMKLNESAEDTVIREVKEEIGQDVNEVQFIRSFPYEAKEMLMLGFKASVKKQDFDLSGEVSLATWVPFEEALGKLREGSIAWQLVKEVVEENKDREISVTDCNITEGFIIASDEEVLEVSKRLMEKNKEAYEVLSK